MNSDSEVPTLEPIASFQPSLNTRAWMTAPHPKLPILATASADKTVKIFSLTTFRQLSSITGGHKRSIRSCAWKPGTRNESVLATGSFDASAGIWRHDDHPGSNEAHNEESKNDRSEDEDDDWRFAVILDGHESEIKSVAWSAGGQFLATCSRDKSVWIWEEMEDDNFETVAVLQEHDGDIKYVRWHPEEDLLASAGYDDTIRLYREDVDDWICVSTIDAHQATVWSLDFEPPKNPSLIDSVGPDAARQKDLQELEKSGPRLASCSDDLTIRIWRRTPKGGAEDKPLRDRIPSIIRTNNVDEEWLEDACLPKRHERAIYSVAWSPKSGLIASTGSDGKIVVYQEFWRDSHDQDEVRSEGPPTETSREWKVVAEVENAHDIFEVNHVCWTVRADRGRSNEGEEVLISTGDDGEVKMWSIQRGT
ncbi:WD40 repeat-like protein [Eremomyces bilateralis CBS 781.70]|uniref:Probable cytosolic iron-sulfur protein assembly protein 1 n=1 Tax=Eremomyces bilateralis CBS 781.70 TaxID=1392243 RepID=A0A6G1G8S5_9PEZI|nr:WD40 repeat-like protein [Eremomyces bilateralis CBS 781.70]KAF1814423.1 WD40 repeat-like protein [Eremomyces bilateralis CBS 781.70]